MTNTTDEPPRRARTTKRRAWRLGVLAALALGSLATVLGLEPIEQDRTYHDFADRRSVLGIPNALDVMTNALFLLVGAWGWLQARRIEAVWSRRAWSTFAVGVALVAFGSGYYHWSPSNDTLVWDRLPMTIGFMGFFAAMLDEHLHELSGRWLLAPLVLIGLASVWWWAQHDDLRFYVWVQFVPLLAIPVLLLAFPPPFTHRRLFVPALALYVAAKVAEAIDARVLQATAGAFSGHSLKHVLAATGCAVVVLILALRRPLGEPTSPTTAPGPLAS